MLSLTLANQSITYKVLVCLLILVIKYIRARSCLVLKFVSWKTLIRFLMTYSSDLINVRNLYVPFRRLL